MGIGRAKGLEMNLQALKSQLASNKISSVYVFTGPEWVAQKTYINHIAKIRGLEVRRIESIADVFSKLKNSSFIRTDFVYVARDDSEFMQNEKLQDQLSSVMQKSVYISLVTSVDKRTKFYKKYQNDMVEFEYFSDKILKKYIQKSIDLSDAYCQKLIDICESDYGRILLEIDKIKQYQKTTEDVQWDGTEKTTTKSCFNTLLSEGVIYRPPKDAIFDFVNAVLNRSTKCWDLLYQSYAVGEANMVLLSVLYNNIKQTLQVQSCKSSDISKSTGLTGWQIKCVKEYVNNYSNGELVAGMKLLEKISTGIKTGQIEDEFSVQYFLCNFL